MPTDRLIKSGDWVVVKSLGEKGVVVTVGTDGYYVRVPRTDDWPYPDNIHAAINDVRRTRPPSFQSNNSIEEIEEALL